MQLGMETSVSAEKSKNLNSDKTSAETKVEAIVDPGAAVSIISRDLAKKVSMIILEKGEATKKDDSNKHMVVKGRG